jgi:hypothetical protein
LLDRCITDQKTIREALAAPENDNSKAQCFNMFQKIYYGHNEDDFNMIPITDESLVIESGHGFHIPRSKDQQFFDQLIEMEPQGKKHTIFITN